MSEPRHPLDEKNDWIDGVPAYCGTCGHAAAWHEGGWCSGCAMERTRRMRLGA